MAKRQQPENVSLGVRVRDLRKAQTMSLERLAQMSECSVSTIRRLEGNQQYPTIARVSAIATALGTTVAELLKGVDLDGLEAQPA